MPQSSDSHVMGKTGSILNVFTKSSKVSHRDQPQLVPLQGSDTNISAYHTRSQSVVHPSKRKDARRVREGSMVLQEGKVGGQASIRDMLEWRKEILSEDAQTYRTGSDQICEYPT